MNELHAAVVVEDRRPLPPFQHLAGLDGLAYNETADTRSWAAMLRLFDGTLK